MLKKKETEILKLKSTIYEIKNSHNRLELAEESANLGPINRNYSIVRGKKYEIN